MRAEKVTIPSITCLQKHHVQRSVLSYIITNRFRIAPLWHDLLDSYYLLYWSPEYTKSAIKEGCIYRANKKYLVIWHNCTPEQVYTSENQVMLSFRAALDDFALPAYVLITTQS